MRRGKWSRLTPAEAGVPALVGSRFRSGSRPTASPTSAEPSPTCYRSNDFARIAGQRTHHQKTRRCTPRHNGKAERYQRIMTEELVYAREYASEDERSQAIAIWSVHYDYHRPRSAAGGQPPASRRTARVTNVRPSHT
jgi:transposase InsO family protein